MINRKIYGEKFYAVFCAKLIYFILIIFLHLLIHFKLVYQEDICYYGYIYCIVHAFPTEVLTLSPFTFSGIRHSSVPTAAATAGTSRGAQIPTHSGQMLQGGTANSPEDDVMQSLQQSAHS